jgi:predicted ester cyclase
LNRPHNGLHPSLDLTDELARFEVPVSLRFGTDDTVGGRDVAERLARSSSCTIRSWRPARTAYADAVAVLWSGFPDLAVEVLDLVAENDRVVARYIERGTHTGDFMGLAPTARSYEKHGFTLYRLDGGRLAEAWLQEDDQGYQQQLFG